MKSKIASILAVMIFGLGILFVSIDRSASPVNKSLAVANLEFEITPEEVLVAPLVPKINYYLPYPGMLPDHPLYRIKMVRDRIWFWLTPDLVKKSELFLLAADKRLGAGKVLIEGNKPALGITTLWKSEKYLERAVETVFLAKEKDLKVGQLTENLKTASLKHEEVLIELKEKVNGEGKTAIEEIIIFLQQVESRASSL
jgi:hypothetical protein